MSEEHDVDFAGDKQTELCESEEIHDGVDTREISASVSVGEPSAINKDKVNKRSLNTDDEKNKGTDVKNIGAATIKWVQEDELFKVSWNLPEGTTSKKDYVALYCKGESIVNCKKYSSFIMYEIISLFA